jgi:radical SAM protein with 4Fe4S-binding SPASM domain
VGGVMFNTVAIETYSKCDNKCPFCPVAYKPRKDYFMEATTVIHTIQQLEDLRYTGHIHWHFFNEPTLDPNLSSYIAVAAKHLPKCYQVVSTNGNQLTVEMVNQLREAGVNAIVVNKYNNGPKLAAVLDKLKGLKSDAWARGHGIYKGKRPFSISVLDKTFYYRKETCKNRKYRMNNRGGNIEKFLPALKEPLKKKCVRPFRQLEINAWGDVAICCQDYNVDVKLGNVNETPIWDIWTSKIAEKYRKELRKGNRKNLKFCNKCDFDGGAFQMNLNVKQHKPKGAK